MKKTPRKLVLRGQILRVLGTIDLGRAVGGGDSGDVQCPAVVDTGRVACDTGAAVVDTGRVACATGAAVVATTACG